MRKQIVVFIGEGDIETIRRQVAVWLRSGERWLVEERNTLIGWCGKREDKEL